MGKNTGLRTTVAMLAFIFHIAASYGSYPDTATAVSEVSSDTAVAHKPGIITRFLNYFNDANKNRQHRKFDFSIIGGPHYSTDTKLGIGLVAAGLYRSDKNDTILPPSNISLFSDVSTVGFYMLGLRGTHIFPDNRYRLEHTLYFFSFPSNFWGIGYEMGNNSDNKSEMKRWQARVKSSFLIRVTDNFFIGPTIVCDYVRGTKAERPELMDGMSSKTWNLGAGIQLQYDTRDVLTNPHKGLYINLTQVFRPAFIGNDYAFQSTDFQICAYKSIWKGGILAGDIRSTFNFGSPHWGMMALLGGSNSMRGYYEGRYRDKHKIEAQIELRQHIWKRNGITAWLGAGEVFNKTSSIQMSRILPNYGIGYRWEFKKDVNVRLDYGFGKNGQSGFLFNINEAF